MAIFNGRTGNDNRQPPGFEAEFPEGNERHEASFGGLDDRDLEEYEEPDRDTGFTSGFRADDMAGEEDDDELFADEDEEDASPSAAHEVTTPEDEPDEGAEDWDGEDDYFDEDDEPESGWPLRMIAVAVVAVGLVAVGVYGVLQERAATQAELTELRATLATSADREDVRTARDSLRELQQAYDTLAAESGALSRENLELRETVAALEARLPGAKTPADAQSQVAAKTTVAAETPVAEKKPVAAMTSETTGTLAEALAIGAEITGARPATPAPQPVAKPAPAAPAAMPATPAAGEKRAAATSPSGRWFVNFGSYTSRSTAENWASRLRPAEGEVIVAPGTRDDQTYFRVRVVGLGDKGAADRVARQLETEMQVSQLWVGQE